MIKTQVEHTKLKNRSELISLNMLHFTAFSRRLTLVFASVFLIITSFAQVSEKINYQAVARDTAGSPIADSTLSVQIQIISKSISGNTDSLIYDEQHNATTNRFGLFTLQIGDGAPLGGGSVTLYDNISWGGNSKFLNVSIGGIDMGTTELVSVPFALYAKEAGNVLRIDSTFLFEDSLYVVATNQGNDTTNLLPLLSLSAQSGLDSAYLSGDTNLVIASGGDTFNISLASLLDNTDNQNLSFSNDTLYLENSDTIFLGNYLDNTDEQTLSVANDSLFISNGNGIPFNDNDSTNERITNTVLSPGPLKTLAIFENGTLSSSVSLQSLSDSIQFSEVDGTDLRLVFSSHPLDTSVIDLSTLVGSDTAIVSGLIDGSDIKLYNNVGDSVLVDISSLATSLELANEADLRLDADTNIQNSLDSVGLLVDGILNTSVDSSTTNELIDSLTLTGSIIKIYEAGNLVDSIDLTPLLPVTTDSLQSVELNGDFLVITDGNGTADSVDISSLATDLELTSITSLLESIIDSNSAEIDTLQSDLNLVAFLTDSNTLEIDTLQAELAALIANNIDTVESLVFLNDTLLRIYSGDGDSAEVSLASLATDAELGDAVTALLLEIDTANQNIAANFNLIDSNSAEIDTLQSDLNLVAFLTDSNTLEIDTLQAELAALIANNIDTVESLVFLNDTLLRIYSGDGDSAEVSLASLATDAELGDAVTALLLEIDTANQNIAANFNLIDSNSAEIDTLQSDLNLVAFLTDSNTLEIDTLQAELAALIANNIDTVESVVFLNDTLLRIYSGDGDSVEVSLASLATDAELGDAVTALLLEIDTANQNIASNLNLIDSNSAEIDTLQSDLNLVAFLTDSNTLEIDTLQAELAALIANNIDTVESVVFLNDTLLRIYSGDNDSVDVSLASLATDAELGDAVTSLLLEIDTANQNIAANLNLIDSNTAEIDTLQTDLNIVAFLTDSNTLEIDTLQAELAALIASNIDTVESVVFLNDTLLRIYSGDGDSVDVSLASLATDAELGDAVTALLLEIDTANQNIASNFNLIDSNSAEIDTLQSDLNIVAFLTDSNTLEIDTLQAELAALIANNIDTVESVLFLNDTLLRIYSGDGDSVEVSLASLATDAELGDAVTALLLEIDTANQNIASNLNLIDSNSAEIDTLQTDLNIVALLTDSNTLEIDTLQAELAALISNNIDTVESVVFLNDTLLRIYSGDGDSVEVSLASLATDAELGDAVTALLLEIDTANQNIASNLNLIDSNSAEIDTLQSDLNLVALLTDSNTLEIDTLQAELAALIANNIDTVESVVFLNDTLLRIYSGDGDSVEVSLASLATDNELEFQVAYLNDSIDTVAFYLDTLATALQNHIDIDLDTDNTNEVQTITFNSGTSQLTLSNPLFNPLPIDLSSLANDDANELISSTYISGDTFYIVEAGDTLGTYMGALSPDTLNLIFEDDSNYAQITQNDLNVRLNGINAYQFQGDRMIINQSNGNMFFVQDHNGGWNLAFSSISNVMSSTFTGNHNFIFGRDASRDNLSGSDNISLGNRALRENETGSANIVLGPDALTTILSGDNNIAIGSAAGNQITSGSNNILIGSGAGSVASSTSNTIKIGTGAGSIDTNDNRVFIGSIIYGEMDNNILQVNGSFKTNNLSGDTLTYPNVDGTNGYVLTTDGNGLLTFQQPNAFSDTIVNVELWNDSTLVLVDLTGDTLFADLSALATDDEVADIEAELLVQIALYTSQLNNLGDSIQYLDDRADSISMAAQANTTSITNQSSLLNNLGDSIQYLDDRADSISTATQNNTFSITNQTAQLINLGDSIQYLDDRADSISAATQNNTFSITSQTSQLNILGDSIQYLDDRADSISTATQNNTFSITSQTSQLNILGDSIQYLDDRADSISTATQNNTFSITSQTSQLNILGDSIQYLDDRADSISAATQNNTFSITSQTSQLNILGDSIQYLDDRADSISTATQNNTAAIGTNTANISNNASAIATHVSNDNDTSASNELIDSTYISGDTFYIVEAGDTLFTFLGGISTSTDTLDHIRNTDSSDYVSVSTANQVNIALDDTVRYQFLDGKVQFENAAVYIGKGAGSNNAYTGEDSLANVGIGLNALGNGDDFVGNTAVGTNAMQTISITGTYNSAFGLNALRNNINGGGNVALGYNALRNLSSGSTNTAIGTFALQNASSNGGGNTALGHSAGRNTIGSNNIFLGGGSGLNATGDWNLFIGQNAGANSTGSNELYIDNSSTNRPIIWGNLDPTFANRVLTINSKFQTNYNGGDTLTYPTLDGSPGSVLTTNGQGILTFEPLDGYDSTRIALGDSKVSFDASDSTIQLLLNNTVQYQFYKNRVNVDNPAVYMGQEAGLNDPQAYDDSLANVGIGYHALRQNNGNSGSVAIGAEALKNNILNGPDNTAIGNQAMKNNTNGGGNVAVGKSALKNANNPNGNIAIGNNTLGVLTTGNGNVSLGGGYSLTSGGGNVFIGQGAGESGSYNHRLYINNSASSTPLIYGDFNLDSLVINGKLNLAGNYTFPNTAPTVNRQVLKFDGTELIWDTILGTAFSLAWDTTSTMIYNTDKNVGMGTSFTSARLEVTGNNNFTFNAINNAPNNVGDHKAVFATTLTNNINGDNYALYGNASNSTGNNIGVYGNGSGTAGTNIGVYATASGANKYAGYFDNANVYISNRLGIGVPSPLRKLEILGDLGADSVYADSIFASRLRAEELYINTILFPNSTSATANDVLTFNGTGYEWQAPSASAQNLSSTLSTGNDGEFQSITNLSQLSIGTTDLGSSGTLLNIFDSTASSVLSLKGQENGISFSQIRLESDETVDKTWYLHHRSAVEANRFQIEFYDGSAWNQYFIIDTMGRAGLGTTSPAAQLGIESSLQYGLDLKMTGTQSGNNFGFSLLNSQSSTQTNIGYYSQMSGAAATNKGFEAIVNGGSTNIGLNADAIDADASENIGVRALVDSSTANYALAGYAGSQTSGAAYAVYGNAMGEGDNYAGYFENGAVYIGDSLIMPQGAQNGYVLQTDASGLASWVDPSSLSVNVAQPWDTSGNYVYNQNDSIGIGTNGPISRLTLYTSDTLGQYTEITTGAATNLSIAGAFKNTDSGLSLSKYGLFTESTGANGNTNVGIIGRAENADLNNIAVHGNAVSNGTNNAYAIFGNAIGTGTNYAGYFQNGNIYVNDKLGINNLTPDSLLDVTGGARINRLNINSAYTFPTNAPSINQVLKYDGTNLIWSIDEEGNATDSTTASNGLTLLGNDVSLGGTLSIGTEINQDFNTLNFNAVGLNGFNVDTNTFSVDGSNNRVGIGLTAPMSPLQVRASETGNDFLSNGLLVQNESTNAGQKAYITARTNHQNAAPIFSLDINNVGGYSMGMNGADTSLRFTADPDFSSTSIMTMKNNGRIGIGTNTPSRNLDVEGDFKADSAFIELLSINNTYWFSPNGGTDGQFLRFESDSAVWQDGIESVFLNADGDSLFVNRTNGTTLSYEIASGTDNLGNHTATQALNLNGNYLSGDGDEEGIYIDTNGNVGIGTSAPITALEVGGSGYFQDSVGVGTVPEFGALDVYGFGTATYTFGSNEGKAFGLIASSDNSGVDTSFAIFSDPAGSSPYSFYGNNGTLYNKGKVGIGTSNPDSALTVIGGINTDHITITDGASNGYYLRSDADGNAIWDTLDTPTINTCPVGYTQVNSKYCIQNAIQSATSWFSAASTCSAADAKLPSWSEWYVGVQAAGVSGPSLGNWEWIDQLSQNNASIVGGGTGTANQTRGTDAPEDSNAFRCVYYLNN